jgi:hypothetical protein
MLWRRMTHRQERAEFRASARPLAAVASIISGIAWLAWELSRRVWDDGASSDCAAPADFYNDATFAVATVAAAVALAALFWLLHGALRWFCLAAALGAAAWGVGNSVEHCVAEPFFLLYVGGGLMYVLATCGLAAGLLVTGQLGRWPGLLLGVAALGSLVVDFEGGGAAVTGVAWLTLGVLLALTSSGDTRAGSDTLR